MQLALVHAEHAAEIGEVPVGAIAVLDEKVIGRGFNAKEAKNDPTAHAEMMAMRQAADHLGNWRLINVALFSTLEPCPMCAGAMIQARLSRLVFAAKDIRFGVAGTVVNILAEPQFNHRVHVTSGILENQAAMLLQAFFQGLRQNQ